MSITRATLASLTTLLALIGALTIMPAVATAEECPNAAYRTGPSAHLPDCRAYELVSPAEKNEGAPFITSYSPDGLSATMVLTSALPGLEGFPEAGFKGPEATYTTQRTASGWVTVGANLPTTEYQPLVNLILPDDFAGEDLGGQTTLWIERRVSEPGNSLGIFERLPDHSIVKVGPGVPPTTPTESLLELSGSSELNVKGISDDASHVVFRLLGDYWPGDDTESRDEGLYEYAGTNNTAPMLVGVNEAGTPISKCGTVLGGPNNTHNAMSSNGKTLFFTAMCGSRVENEVYARIDNGEPDAQTVDISEPSKADCSACDTEAGVLTEDASFEGASRDGTKVFFSTTQPLLDGDTSRNLYEYDFDAPAGDRVTRIAGAVPHAEVISGLHTMLAEDGSHAYFLARGVLTSVPNGQGEAAEASANNLYVFERDASYPEGRIEFVARLSKEDLSRWETTEAPADLTPDGRFLVFESERDLTPDTTSSGIWQIFEYDAQTAALIRVSVGQDGFNNNGNVPPIPIAPSNPYTFNNATNASLIAPGAGITGDKTLYGYRYSPDAYSTGTSVSADGSYIFFESSVGLTPQAFDRKLLGYEPSYDIPIYANNVYEYHNGRVSLISDGQDIAFKPIANKESMTSVKLLGTDESGHDVLFTTVDRLVGQDTDTSLDIYDARIDGGFPAPAGASACVGEACQGELSGAPTLLSPGSEFQAGGNPPLTAPSATEPKATPKAKSKSKKCKRGATLKRDKCVKSKGKRVKKTGNKRRAK